MREEALHLGGRTEMAFGVCGEGASGFVEMRVKAHAGEEIEEFAFGTGGAGDAAGGEQREAVGIGELDAGGVCLFLASLKMALEFDEEVVLSKRIPEAGNRFVKERGVMGAERFVEGAVVVAGQGDQTGRGFREFVPADAGESFGTSEMRAGEESAEVAVPFLGTNQYGQDGSVFEGEFGSGDGTDSVFRAGAVQARDSVESVTIGEGDGGQVAVCGVASKGIGGGGAPKKAERAASVEFNVTHLQAGVFEGTGGGGSGHWAAS
jgi:hypothetical protein